MPIIVGDPTDPQNLSNEPEQLKKWIKRRYGGTRPPKGGTSGGGGSPAEPAPEPEPVIETPAAPEPEPIENPAEKLKGTSVIVEYRDPYGTIKSFQTKDIERAMSGLSGEITNIYEHAPTGGRGQILYDARKEVTSNLTLYEQAKQEYIGSSGEIPGWAREQIKVPSEITMAGAGETYLTVSYMKFLGMDTSVAEEKLQSELMSSEWYMSTQPLYDDPSTEVVETLTLSEFRQREPAIYLTQQESGVYTPGYDFGRWYSEKRTAEEKENLLLAKVKQATTGLLNFPSPEFWVSAVKGKEALHEYLGKWEYGQRGQHPAMVWASVQAPAYINIILPFLGGAAFRAGLAAVGSAASTTGGALGAAMGQYAAKMPYIAGTTVLGLMGADIGRQAAYEQHGLAPGGSTISKISQYGLILGSASAGAYWAGQPGTIRAAEEFYSKLYRSMPAGVKKLGYDLKTGYMDYRFSQAQKTGKGMFYEKELTNIYSPGQWKDIPYNIITRTSYPFREPRLFITDTGDVIPLESYQPVIPDSMGRIVDVGKMPDPMPGLATGGAKRWGYDFPDAVKMGFDPGISYKPFTTQVKGSTMYSVPKSDLKIVHIKKATVNEYLGRYEWYQTPVKSISYTPSMGGVGVRLPSGYALAMGYVSLSYLGWLEEGTGIVHPRWKGRTAPVVDTALGIQPDVSMGLKVDSLIGQELKIGTKSLLDYESIMKVDVKQDLLKIKTPDYSKASASAVSPMLALGLASRQAQVLQPVLKQIQQYDTSVVSVPAFDPMVFSGFNATSFWFDMPGMTRRKTGGKRKKTGGLLDPYLWRVHPVQLDWDILTLKI